MVQRLERPLTHVATFTGPVKLGRFDDGTLIIAGPLDEPIMIRDGQVRRLLTKHPNGDLVFEGAVSAAGQGGKDPHG